MRLCRYLLRRSTAIGLAIAAYGGVCIALLRAGGPVGLIALVPLVVLPLLGGLAYWLIWQEYHR